VILVDRDAQAAHTASSQLGNTHTVSVPVLAADLSTVAGIESVAKRLTSRSDVGALVNNAGGWLPGDQYPDSAPGTWPSALTLNLLAPMLLTQLLWPALAAATGAVVNIGSSGGAGDDPYRSPEYGAAKAAIRRFTASLGSRTGVRVMAVVPGWIGLDRARQRWATLSTEQQRDIGALIPPEDIAGAVAALLEHGRSGQIIDMPQRAGRHLPPTDGKCASRSRGAAAKSATIPALARRTGPCTTGSSPRSVVQHGLAMMLRKLLNRLTVLAPPPNLR
jgi:short-subunit dehydrogenase